MLTLAPQADGLRAAPCADAQWQWLRGARLWQSSGTVELTTAPDEETGVVVLAGTHDIEANGSSWASRGTRASPFEGRPFALFLPPGARFRARSDAGEILLLAARRPPPGAVATPAPKPLLPLAGANKAFDAATGAWQPLEMFPDAAEAIQPRHMAKRDVNGVLTQQILPMPYKAHGLCLFEAVLHPGQELAVPLDDAAAGYPAEWMAYWRAEDEAAVGSPHATQPLRREGIVAASGAARFAARRGRCYVAVAYAGHKPAR